MHVVIIGGTGHVGTYLVPRLVTEGYTVTVISRNKRKAYQPDPLWSTVNMVVLDREQLEQDGSFADEVRKLQPDIVIDMICFTEESARMMVAGLAGNISHYLQCGSMWVHGYGVELPVEETDEKIPLCDYGQQKLAIEQYLLKVAAAEKFPATVLHPGHIVGKGWAPVNPAGNLNMDVFKKLESIHKGGSSEVVINWHYEEDDEDMLEAGEDYQAIINIPFKMILSEG